MFGSHYLKGWSKTQAIIALSSGEAELAALVKGSVELLGMRSIMQDFGYQTSLGLSTDATAAIGMVTREGLGKVRHLAVADLSIMVTRPFEPFLCCPFRLVLFSPLALAVLVRLPFRVLGLRPSPALCYVVSTLPTIVACDLGLAFAVLAFALL